VRPQTVSRMIAAHMPPHPRVGVVTAFDATTVTVNFGDAPTAGLIRDVAYSPAVGDRVLVIPAETAWVVMGRISPAPVVPDPETVTVRAADAVVKSRRVDTGAWEFDMPTDVEGPWLQGRGPAAYGWEPERLDDYATILRHGPLATHVPTGATVNAVSLLVERATRSQGPRLVRPVLWAHGHTGDIPDGAPTWVRPGITLPAVAPGETARLALPAEWITAWLAGQIAGIGFYAERVDAYSEWFNPVNGGLEITYTPAG
jgi:hypothetical protein